MAAAVAAVEARNPRGCGQLRFHEVSLCRQAGVQGVQRYGVEDCLWLRYSPHVQSCAVRGYQGRPARVEEERQATVEVRVDEAALEAALCRLGWRLYGTQHPREQWSLAQAVWAYRNA